MAYYPVTPQEVEAGKHRPGELSIPVREDVPLPGGVSIPMLSWGHPDAWEVITHNGKLYGVFRRDRHTREFAP